MVNSINRQMQQRYFGRQYGTILQKRGMISHKGETETMARRKKPEGETAEQAKTRRLLESVSNHATRGEKVSWNRMMDNMVSLLAKLKPIEDKIVKLQVDKMLLIDEVQALRQRMVRECVHPYEQLVLKADNTVQCKFCNHLFYVNTKETNNGV